LKVIQLKYYLSMDLMTLDKCISQYGKKYGRRPVTVVIEECLLDSLATDVEKELIVFHNIPGQSAKESIISDFRKGTFKYRGVLILADSSVFMISSQD